MTALATSGFPARRGADRNAFLLLTALVWVGVLSGFGSDIAEQIATTGLHYPLIVHLHAAVFVGWLVLFTVQVALIRNGRADLHRRLGLAGAALAGLMLGPAAALIVDAAAFVATGKTPQFLAIQLTDMVAFAGLAGAGLLLRDEPAAHKRVMLLALVYISAAGFSRLLNVLAAAPLAPGFWHDMVRIYLGSDLLALGLGAYDLVTRRRLHPAYLAGAAWMLAVQLTARTLLRSPAWMLVALRLIGH